MDQLEVVKERVLRRANIAKWGLGLVGVLLVAPVIWMLAYAVLGAAALGVSLVVAGVVGLTIVNMAPVVTMKLANAKIKAIMAEAARNPIPTLWNEWEKDGEELREFEKAIADYATEIENVQSKAKKLTVDLKPEDLQQFQDDIDAMRQDLALQQGDLDQARQEHEQFRLEVKRASAIWDLNMAVSKANAKNLNRAEETMARIKKETALDTVTASMNRSKAQLRERIRSRTTVNGMAQIGNEPSASLPLPTSSTYTKVRA